MLKYTVAAVCAWYYTGGRLRLTVKIITILTHSLFKILDKQATKLYNKSFLNFELEFVMD